MLGPLEIRDGENNPLVPARRKQRVLLALLLIHANNAVAIDSLVDALWPRRPPASATANLHTYVSDLRRLLRRAAEGGDRIGKSRDGYVIHVAPEELDVSTFERLSAEGRQAALDGHASVAADKLLRALALWRGPALDGLPLTADLHTEADRLEELRLATIEEAGQARLALGAHADLAAELQVRTAQHPLREQLWGQLMLALFRCGRNAEAIATYTRVEKILDEKLGVRPSQPLRDLHRRILIADPSLDLPPAPLGERPPRHLPTAPAAFTGRSAELRRLDAFTFGTGAGEADAPAIVVITGTVGVGKTSLAVHWAHRAAYRFSDGQLYVNLRGFDPTGKPVVPAEALRGFLDALAVPAERMPASPDAQAALYRSLLSGRRMLIVLDNARDAEQVRPLLPGSPGCLVLVTSRNQLTGLVVGEGAHPVTLDLFTDAEARKLLARHLGQARLDTDRRVADELIARCARLPLALAIVAARAAMQPTLPLAAFAAQLADTRERLDALDTGDPTTQVRAAFSWSYRQLDTAAARLFRLLGLHPGPDISVMAAASLTGLPPIRVRPLLAELARAHLVIELTAGRYAFHDLLRAYAAEQAHTIDPDQQRRTATIRMLDHYLHTAHTAARLLYPNRDPITLPPPETGTTPENPAHDQEALDWFTTEHAVLLAVVDHAAATGFDTHTWQVAWTLTDFLSRRGHWHDQAAAQQAAAAAAGRLADPAAQALTHRLLASAYTRLGRYDDAHTQLRHALHLHRQTGDLAGQAHAISSLGHLWKRRGHPAEAMDHAQQALNLFRAAGHGRGQALALNAIGWYHTLLGDHRQALTYCKHALRKLQELGDRDGQAATWDSLGYANHNLGRHRRAVTCYRHALDLYRDLGDRYNEADTLIHLGDTHHTAGNHVAARTAWQQALAILEQIDHPDTGRLRAKLATLDRPSAAGSVVIGEWLRHP